MNRKNICAWLAVLFLLGVEIVLFKELHREIQRYHLTHGIDE